MTDSWKNIQEMLHWASFLCMSEIIKTELMSNYHDKQLADYFGINKNWQVIAWKYYWSTFWADVRACMKACHFCLAFRAVCHKLYGNLQLLPISIHWYKDLSMDFLTCLPVLTNWKSSTYDFILFIVEQRKKFIQQKPI